LMGALTRCHTLVRGYCLHGIAGGNEWNLEAAEAWSLGDGWQRLGKSTSEHPALE